MNKGMIVDMKSQKISRKEQESMVKGILLNNMLDHLGISLRQYFRMTTDRERLRHIIKCNRCPDPGECVHMLMGEDIDPETFCPNIAELKQLM